MQAPIAPARRTPTPALTPAGATLLVLGLLLAWDASGLDLPLAALWGDAGGFALREHWLLSTLLHQGGRLLSWALALLLCLGVVWPMGALRALPRARRRQLAFSTLAAVAAVAALKSVNATSCPWDLQAFGGLARHLPHWAGFVRTDGGAGHCFPAGHASAGFAFVGGYFAFRHDAPALARRWLLGALGAGLLLGLGQQMRGAHFMSHTLWSGALCWLVAWAIDLAAAVVPGALRPLESR